MLRYVCSIVHTNSLDMKPLITVLFLALLISACYAQERTQTVRGRIVDAQSKFPLAGVNVVVGTNPLIGAASDAEGDYTFTDVPVTNAIEKYRSFLSTTMPGD